MELQRKKRNPNENVIRADLGTEGKVEFFICSDRSEREKRGKKCGKSIINGEKNIPQLKQEI